MAHITHVTTLMIRRQWGKGPGCDFDKGVIRIRQRRTDNTMTKQRTKRLPMVHKQPNRKRKIAQFEHHFW